MDDVVFLFTKAGELLHHPAIAHEPVLGVKRDRACRYTPDISFVSARTQVVWRDQMDGVTQGAQIGAKGLNRR